MTRSETPPIDAVAEFRVSVMLLVLNHSGVDRSGQGLNYSGNSTRATLPVPWPTMISSDSRNMQERVVKIK